MKTNQRTIDSTGSNHNQESLDFDLPVEIDDSDVRQVSGGIDILSFSFGTASRSTAPTK